MDNDLNIEEAEFTPLVTPGTKDDEALQAAAQNVDENVELFHADDETDDDLEATPELLVEFFANALVMVSERLAVTRGEHWQFTEKEVDKLCNSLGKYAQSAFPGAKLTPGWALLGTTAIIVSPRIMKDAEIAAEAAKAKQGHEDVDTNQAD